MPELDGISATKLIRKFDHMTPIISMTSHLEPSEIMVYYSSGTWSRPWVLFDIGINKVLSKFRYE